MFDFVQHILLGLSMILTLAFPVLLILLCIRTCSKGLVIITAVLIFSSTFDLISRDIMKPFLGQWSIGELNNGLTQNITKGEFMTLYIYVTRIFYNGLLALGAFLIYREWSRGQIRWNRQKLSEVVNHA